MKYHRKSFGKTLKNFVQTKKSKNPISLKIDNNLTSDSVIVADTLNIYFATIADKYTPVYYF